MRTPNVAVLVVLVAALVAPVEALAGNLAGDAAGHSTSASATARTALLDGVSSIASPGTPGSLVCFGPEAFVVVSGRSGDDAVAVVAAAAPRGDGRIVAFAHGGYAAAGALAEGDTGRLLVNAVRWCGPDRQRKGRPLRVGLWRAGDLAALLAAAPGDEQGAFETVVLPDDPAIDWREALGACDVVCCFSPDLDERRLAALRAFADRGGGLVLGQTPWGWAQVRAGRGADADVRSNPFNALVGHAGFAWTGDTAGPSSGDRFVAGNDDVAAADPLLHGGAALEALERRAHQPEPRAAALDRMSVERATASATLAARWLPRGDRTLRPRLDRLLDDAGDALVPTKERPLDASMGLERVLLAHQLRATEDLPARSVRAHPAASAFPGAVPAGARRVARDLEIDLGRPRWHGTGLYAVSGVPLVVEASPEAAEAGVVLRVGCHTDRLWHKDAWHRVPEIASAWPLRAGRNEFASAFGGLVYIDVPARKRGRAKATASVRVAGAVEAPRFVLGETSREAWQRLRSAPAPWAELETDRVVVSVPSEAVRALDDPTAVLETWNRVLDAAADLATISRERERPERYVADVQISAGYMHSGYPIMTHLDAVDDMTDAARLGSGAWGLFHELGHNHQDGMWTFGGTVEVTCNLFSLYIGQTVCGWGPREGHGALAQREPKLARHLAEGAPFERWKSDPFLALAMYQQLQEAFGWEAYQRVFATYRDLPQDDRPRTDAAKRDQWMVRFSRAVGHDLGPFFERWGVPVSDEARASVADLPGWMPEGLDFAESPRRAGTSPRQD